jgi:hypothetical protein
MVYESDDRSAAVNWRNVLATAAISIIVAMTISLGQWAGSQVGQGPMLSADLKRLSEQIGGLQTDLRGLSEKSYTYAMIPARVDELQRRIEQLDAKIDANTRPTWRPGVTR